MNHNQLGRFGGLNRYGEDHIHHVDFGETYEDERGMRHTLDWSHDPRSEAAGEAHHWGKGPKNYKRSDARIFEDVCERLKESTELDARTIEVSVDEGVVTLKGEVMNRDQKRLAEWLIERTSGVQDILNELRLLKKEFPEGAHPGGLIKGLL